MQMKKYDFHTFFLLNESYISCQSWATDRPAVYMIVVMTNKYIKPMFSLPQLHALAHKHKREGHVCTKLLKRQPR